MSVYQIYGESKVRDRIRVRVRARARVWFMATFVVRVVSDKFSPRRATEPDL